MTEPTAAMRYKAIVARAHKAAEELREWELERAKELEDARANAEAEVAAAREREEETARNAKRWWRMAADNISRLTWLQAGAEPEPSTAHGERLDQYAEQIRPAYQELTQAVLALGWRAR